MGWWILLSVVLFLFFLLTILLLTNLVLFIDTRHHRYEIQFGWIADAHLIMKENHPGIDLRVFWMHFFLDFFTMGGTEEKHEKKEKKQRKKKGGSANTSRIFRIIKAVFKSFRIRQLELSLDTESGVWNGLLIPLQYIINQPNISVRVNWTGERYLVMEIQNSAGRVGWTVLRALVFKG